MQNPFWKYFTGIPLAISFFGLSLSGAELSRSTLKILDEQREYYGELEYSIILCESIRDDAWRNLLSSFDLTAHNIKKSVKLRDTLGELVMGEPAVYELVIHFKPNEHSVLVYTYPKQNIYFLLDPEYGLFKFDGEKGAKKFAAKVADFYDGNLDFASRMKIRKHLVTFLPQRQRCLTNPIKIGAGVCLAYTAHCARLILNSHRVLESVDDLLLTDFDYLNIARHEMMSNLEDHQREKLENAINFVSRIQKLTPEELEKSSEAKEFFLLGNPIKIGISQMKSKNN